MARPVPVHYLRPNEGEWSPTNVVFFDTETTAVQEGDHELHLLRLWCGNAVRRDRGEADQPADHRAHGATAAGFARWLHSQCKGVSTVWAFAHNLSFDLTTTDLLAHMGVLGWRVSQFGSTDRCPWFRLATKTKHLTLVDSWSWLPDALEHIGQLAGVRKPRLPTWDEDDAAWLERCYGDVDVLEKAVLDLMDWWDAQGCGRWSITGASTGWNSMRHKMAPPRILVKPSADAIAFEREGVRGGRRDTWRFGQLDAGEFLELDIERAHGTTVENFLLPHRRLGRFASLSPDARIWRSPALGAMARARVRCEAPRWPARATGATWWPVGEFWTVLAWPELQRARELGELVEVGAGYTYALGRQLQGWARWVNRVASGATPTAPAVATLLAKSWTRSVVGKWAGHKSECTVEGPALQDTWGVEKVVDLVHGCRARIVTLGDDRWMVRQELDADNCFPAVLAWVESYERVALATMIDALGHSVVVHCDTDGLICDLTAAVHKPELRSRGAFRLRRPESQAQAVCDWLSDAVAPYHVRPKGHVASLKIAGPQQLWLDQRRRLAGTARAAEELPTGRFRTKAWPKLWWQARHGRPGAYVRPTITSRAPVNTTHRWVLADETTIPVRMRIGEDGGNEIVPWHEVGIDAPCGRLWRQQHPALERFRC